MFKIDQQITLKENPIRTKFNQIENHIQAALLSEQLLDDLKNGFDF